MEIAACNSRYFIVHIFNISSDCRAMPASAGIYEWYIPLNGKQNMNVLPATAGIFWWYPLRRTSHLYIICTKIKIF